VEVEVKVKVEVEVWRKSGEKKKIIHCWGVLAKLIEQ
jgi:hypothetical protein